jgi:hypothetical protein
MDAILDWYIKDRVILHRPVGVLSLEMVQQNNDHIIEMLGKGSPPIHILADARLITKLPTNLLKMSQSTSFFKHPALGWVVIVTTNSTINFLGNMLPQINALQHYRVLSEFDKGITFLKEQDSTVDWTSINQQLFEE